MIAKSSLLVFGEVGPDGRVVTRHRERNDRVTPFAGGEVTHHVPGHKDRCRDIVVVGNEGCRLENGQEIQKDGRTGV